MVGMFEPYGIPFWERKKKYFRGIETGYHAGEVETPRALDRKELGSPVRVSRTPIREAIRKLESMGMVQTVLHQGAKVTDFSFAEIHSLYQVRNCLEKMAGGLACANSSIPEIRELTKINEQLLEAASANNFSKMIEKDQKFHLTLLGFSKNPFLMKAIDDLRLKSYPIAYHVWKKSDHAQTSITEHQRMIQALRKKDKRQLNAIIEKQLNNSKKSYLEFLSKS